MLTLQAIKENALNEHIPIIMDDTLQEIEKILSEKNPNSLLEIGTAVGYSAICFSKYVKQNIDTIEIDEEKAKRAKENIAELKLNDKINIYVGDAVEILPKINKKYDIIFIDASKSKYPFFLTQSLRLLNREGIILADNVLYKGYVLGDYNKHKQRTAVNNLRAFIKEIQENPNLETTILEIGDGLAICKKIM